MENIFRVSFEFRKYAVKCVCVWGGGEGVKRKNEQEMQAFSCNFQFLPHLLKCLQLDINTEKYFPFPLLNNVLKSKR